MASEGKLYSALLTAFSGQLNGFQKVNTVYIPFYLPAYLIYLANIVVAITCSYNTTGSLLHVPPVHILHCLVAENDPNPINPHCWYLLY